MKDLTLNNSYHLRHVLLNLLWKLQTSEDCFMLSLLSGFKIGQLVRLFGSGVAVHDTFL